MDEKKALSLHCSVEAAIAVLGGKYKAIIIWHLNVSGVMRYNELRKAIPQATPKMLSQQLKELRRHRQAEAVSGRTAENGIFADTAGQNAGSHRQRHERLGARLFPAPGSAGSVSGKGGSGKESSSGSALISDRTDPGGELRSRTPEVPPVRGSRPPSPRRPRKRRGMWSHSEKRG